MSFLTLKLRWLSLNNKLSNFQKPSLLSISFVVLNEIKTDASSIRKVNDIFISEKDSCTVLWKM